MCSTRAEVPPAGPETPQRVPLPVPPAAQLLTHLRRDLGRASDGTLLGLQSNGDVTLDNFLNLAKPPFARL